MLKKNQKKKANFFWDPLACEGTLSINFGIVKVMSTSIFEFPRWCGQEDRATKEAWEGQGVQSIAKLNVIYDWLLNFFTNSNLF